ncbi:glycosyltransferase family 2 protein [Mycobacterium sp. AZCC_0083]|uniref:glycosyltransferase family 2 protein n=1 Tax=Mycobacterium sp. AZCC_0083 TaxID=2735882 RepID=UPI00161FBEA0|nr:glycosyltransferase family 2 protein [Mycobacterium sp. AZCC_0083]
MNPSDANESPTTLPVSVCLPMYNNSATIERCLRSVLDQEGVEFEVVVVDDGSSDDSVAVAARMLRPGDRLICNETRVGLNQNHNKCLEHARGRCIQFVHGDDWLLPGALRTMSGCFDDPSVGLAFAPRRVMTDDRRWKRRYGNLQTRFRGLRARNHGPSLVRQMALSGANGNWIGEPTCVMFRHRLALDVGGFRNDIYQLVDLDLWDRLMLRSTVCFVPQELSVRSHTTATETTRVMNTRRFWLDQLRILTWLVMDPASPTATRIIAGVWWLPAWLKVFLETAVFGPQRWSRLKIWAIAPVDEIARARRLRDDRVTEVRSPASTLPDRIATHRQAHR